MLNFKDWINQQDETSPTTRILNAPWAYPVQAVPSPHSGKTATPRQLSNWNYMLKRDTKTKKRKKRRKRQDESLIGEAKKPRQKPDHSIDNFGKEVAAIKDDLVKLKEKRKKEGKAKVKPKDGDATSPTATQPGYKPEPELMKAARIAMSNLRRTPGYYADKKQDTKVDVSDAEVSKIARLLGINFSGSKFNLAAFRQGIHSEMSRSAPPTNKQPKTATG